MVHLRSLSPPRCGYHLHVLNERIPSQACPKCRENKWREAGMRKEKLAAAPTQEFLPRGVEHGKFMNASF